MEMLGVVFDGDKLRLTAKPDRAWRLWYALRTLMPVGSATPRQMQKMLGHLVHHFLLRRCSLSILFASYRFIGDGHGARRELPEAVRTELQVAQGLVHFLRADLARPLH